MNLIDTVIVNIIYIMFPLLCYIFYVSHNKSFSKKSNELFLEIALFTSTYLCVKMGNKELLLINIPLLICFLYKRNTCSLILSTFISFYYILVLNYEPVLIITEYIFYYGMYLIYKYRRLPANYYLIIFIILKFIMNLIYNFHDITSVVFSGIIFVIASYLILVFFKKSLDITNIHMSLKEIEKEKQIRNSLFKITHEIKNPIAVCKGYLDMFDKNNPKHVDKFIPIVRQEINRTLTIMNDFMEFSKIKLNFEIMDIEMLLEEVLETLDNLLNEKNIKLNYQMADDEIFINGDYDRLKQVFINILKNSIEALDDVSKGVIDVNYCIENKNIIIEIKDNGIGMSDEVKEKIFEAFYTTKRCGTGLGVPLSKEIIEGHNGKLQYFSKENGGTKVKIMLPTVKI